MLSFKLTVLAVAAALVSSARADYYIDPDSVALSLRQYWCASEISTCPIICAQTAPFSTLTNTCDAVSLYIFFPLLLLLASLVLCHPLQ